MVFRNGHMDHFKSIIYKKEEECMMENTWGPYSAPHLCRCMMVHCTETKKLVQRSTCHSMLHQLHDKQWQGNVRAEIWPSIHLIKANSKSINQVQSSTNSIACHTAAHLAPCMEVGRPHARNQESQQHKTDEAICPPPSR